MTYDTAKAHLISLQATEYTRDMLDIAIYQLVRARFSEVLDNDAELEYTQLITQATKNLLELGQGMILTTDYITNSKIIHQNNLETQEMLTRINGLRANLERELGEEKVLEQQLQQNSLDQKTNILITQRQMELSRTDINQLADNLTKLAKDNNITISKLTNSDFQTNESNNTFKECSKLEGEANIRYNTLRQTISLRVNPRGSS